MKVKALADFFDIAEKQHRSKGDVWEVDDDRYASLSNRPGALVLVEAVVEDKPKPVKSGKTSKAKK